MATYSVLLIAYKWQHTRLYVVNVITPLAAFSEALNLDGKDYPDRLWTDDPERTYEVFEGLSLKAQIHS